MVIEVGGEDLGREEGGDRERTTRVAMTAEQLPRNQRRDAKLPETLLLDPMASLFISSTSGMSISIS